MHMVQRIEANIREKSVVKRQVMPISVMVSYTLAVDSGVELRAQRGLMAACFDVHDMNIKPDPIQPF